MSDKVRAVYADGSSRDFPIEAMVKGTHANKLAQAGTALRDARHSASEATTVAIATALDAHTDGVPEVRIARQLGVNRSTVRDWLAKRKLSLLAGKCGECEHWAVDPEDMREHIQTHI